MNWILNETPAARAERHGPSGLSDAELLALVIQGPQAGPSAAVRIAQAIIQSGGNFAKVSQWTLQDWLNIPGIGPIKGAQLLSVFEIARRVQTHCAECPIFNRAEIIASFMQPFVSGLEVEKFYVLCLDRKNRLIKQVEISSGTATAALAHPREVFRAACQYSAAAIICVHNHPSGDPAPSAPDLHVTRALREAAKAVDIGLLDHVILGRTSADPLGRGYYSFRESGIL